MSNVSVVFVFDFGQSKLLEMIKLMERIENCMLEWWFKPYGWLQCHFLLYWWF